MKGFQKLWIRNLSLGLACFSLFAIFSLGINTKGVSALRHDVNYIPLASQTSYRSAGGVTDVRNPLFSFAWGPAYAPDFHSKQLKAPLYYYTVSKNDYSGCEYRTGGIYGRGVRVVALPSGSVTISHGFDSYNYFYGTEGNSEFMNVVCRQNISFGVINPSPGSNIIYHPSLDESSLVNIPLLDRPSYISLTRYYYDYDSIYLSDTAIDSSTGIHYSKAFSISELYPEFIPTKFSLFTMPLGKANQSVGAINEGRQIEFDMVLNFKKTSSDQQTVFEWNPDLASNATIRLYVIGEYEDGSASFPLSSIDYTDCSTVLIRSELDEGYPSAQLELSCNYVATHNFLDTHLWFYLQMSAGSSDYLFNTDVDWSFSGTKFITDNDSTPGATWGTEPTGEHLENAPGKATIDNSSDEDFFSSLTNMFQFNLTNPFAGLFDLFMESSGCVNIPILAGMIHSEESQVCPWFSSEVRNIVTPVIGISSVMLLFGFFVSWLKGSSSGFFDDGGESRIVKMGKELK